MTRYILIILIAIITFSCEKTLDFDDEGLADKLVFNSVLSTQKDLTASLTKTSSILEGGYNNSVGIMADGSIEIYEDGNLSKMAESPTGYFVLKDFKPKAGKTYRVVIKSQGKQLEAETKIPIKTDVVLCDTFNVINKYNRKYIMYKVVLKDPIGDDYYRILCTSERLILNKNADGKGSRKYYRSVYEHPIGSDNQVFKSVYNNFGGDVLNNGPENAYNIFPDDYFKNKEYKIDFAPYNFGDANYINPYSGYGYYGTNKDIETIYVRNFVHVQHLSKELYIYLKYLRLYEHYSGNVFSEPVPVYSNVKNGIGILAGLNDDAKFMFEKIYRPFSMDTIKIVNNAGDGYYYGKNMSE